MFELLNPLSRMAVINQAVKSGSKLFTCVISPQTSWFDKNHSDEKKSHAYPFFLGMWAQELLQDIKVAKWIEEFNSKLDPEDPMYDQKVLSYTDPFIRERIKRTEDIERYLTRVTLTFCYVIKDAYYHGLIKIDSPMQTQISVRVSDQRHLVIEPGLVRLMSRADGTVFHEWRPAQKIDGSGKYVWMDSKALITTTYNPPARFCPIYFEDVVPAWNRLYGQTHERMAQQLGLDNAQTVDVFRLVQNQTRDLEPLHRAISSLRLNKVMVPPEFALKYTHYVDHLLGLPTAEFDFRDFEHFIKLAGEIRQQVEQLLERTIEIMRDPNTPRDRLSIND